MVKISNQDASAGFVFGGVAKTVIPSKDSSAKSSVLSSPSQHVHNQGLAVEPSSPSQDNSQKSVPTERCGTTTGESEFTSWSTKRLSQKSEAHPSSLNCSQMSENREQVLHQVADAISNPLGSSSEVIPSETSQWNPDLLNCDICKEICKRAVLVPCCKIQACNGCAVLRIMGGGICWGCSGALRSRDLVNHKYLRIAVEMFRKNGKIEANIQATLSQKQNCEDKNGASSQKIEDGEDKNGASSQKIEDGQEMLSEQLPEDVKGDHGQLASVIKPNDPVAKETHNCSSTERSESSKIAESTDKNSWPTPPNLIEEHLKNPVAVKPKKFSFGWTQSMNKSPFGSPFIKKHGMYSRGTSSTGEGNRVNKDDCKSAKQPVETSRKVILTSPPPNIVERNICMEYGQDHKDIFSSESSISRSSSLWDSDSSCFSKYGNPLPQSEQSGRGAFCSTSRKPYAGGKMSKSSSVGIWRKSRSPSMNNLRCRSPTINFGRSSNIKRKSSRSSSIQYARSRSPGMEHRWRSRSPSNQYRSSTPRICRGRSKSPSVQYGRRSRSPGSGWGRSRSPSIQYARRSRSSGIGCERRSTSPSNKYSGGSRSPGIVWRRRSTSPSDQYTGSSRSSGIGCERRSTSPSNKYSGRSRSPGIVWQRRSTSPSIQYARRSKSPGIGCGRRSTSPSIEYGRRSKSPGIVCGRRSTSPNIQYARRSKSPGIVCGRSRSPSIHYARRSRNPGIVCGRRSTSPSDQYARSRSPGIGCGRSTSSSDQYTRRSRSPGIVCGRSRSPSIHYARRSRSPGIGCGRSTSPSDQYTGRSRSSGIVWGRRSTSPSDQYTGRSRSPGIGCERRSASPSVQYTGRSRSPGIVCGRRSTSPSDQYTGRSRSPGIVCGRRSTSSSDQYTRRSRSPGIVCGRRSTSPSHHYTRRSRSPGIGCGRRSTRTSIQYARRSRSPGIGCGRSTSPSVHYARRSKSPIIGCGRSRRPSVHYARTSRSPGIDFGRRCTSPSINLQRNSKKPRTNNCGNSRGSSRSSSLETLKVSFRNDHQQLDNESLDNMEDFKKVSGRKINSSLIASYSSENESKTPQKLVDFQHLVVTESEYWEQIERLRTDRERLCLAKTQFENPVCSDPRTNLTYHGYKRKKLHMLETEDVDSFYEFFTNPDVVRLKEVKSERRQKFYIKEGKLLPMPGYMIKQELKHVKDVEDVISSEEASKEIIDGIVFKMLIEKGFHQKFKLIPKNMTRSEHKRYKKPLVAHFKRGHEEAMQFLKFYKSEFNRSQLEEVICLEKMYNSFSFHYGKMQPLYCKTCKFAHTF